MPKSRKERPSSTAGKAKGDNCHRSQMKNLWAKDSKFYRKNPREFLKAAILISGMKGNHPTAEVIAMRNGDMLGENK
jgi:hypothetical protein